MTQADLDNGYTRIANEILDALALLDLSGREFRVLNAIIRRTYGFQKKVDWIALSQLVEMTGIAKENVSRILGGLQSKGIIIREGEGYTKKVGINTKLSEWCKVKTVVKSDNGDVAKRQNVDADKLSETTTPIVESDKTIVEIDNNHVGFRQPQKKKESITKESITKERYVDFEKLWKSFDGRFGDKGAKKKANDEFDKIKPDNNLFDDMLRAVYEQTRDKELKNSQGQFCAPFQHVERWLKNRRWEDEISIQLVAQRSRSNPSKSELNDDSLNDYLSELGEQSGDCEGMEDFAGEETRLISGGRY